MCTNTLGKTPGPSQRCTTCLWFSLLSSPVLPLWPLCCSKHASAWGCMCELPALPRVTFTRLKAHPSLESSIQMLLPQGLSMMAPNKKTLASHSAPFLCTVLSWTSWPMGVRSICLLSVSLARLLATEEQGLLLFSSSSPVPSTVCSK